MKGIGAAHQPPEPGWLQKHHPQARRDPSRGDGLAGRPKPNLDLELGSSHQQSMAASHSATFPRLRAFIAERMLMSPIEQPHMD
jgi:hypothetical protein